MLASERRGLSPKQTCVKSEKWVRVASERQSGRIESHTAVMFTCLALWAFRVWGVRG